MIATRLPERAPVACHQCASLRVSWFDLSLTDGTGVTFVSCRDCEGRSYRGPDGHIPMIDLLTRATVPGKGRLPDRVLVRAH